MTPQHRDAADRLCRLLQQENALLERQDYARIGALVGEKQAALSVLQGAGPATGDVPVADRELAATLVQLLDQNRAALQRALRVQDRIMGIMADAARRMMETPLYGGGGIRAVRRTGLAVALVKQA